MTFWLDALSWLSLMIGVVFSLIGGVGILRMPDFWTRAHAASITDTVGVAFILLGLMLQAGPSLITVKLVMILVFLYITSPTAGHALCQAANAHGVPFTPSTRGLAESEESGHDSD
jgi:multicomponent Na+:H+ antiporter subunit G